MQEKAQQVVVCRTGRLCALSGKTAIFFLERFSNSSILVMFPCIVAWNNPWLFKSHEVSCTQVSSFFGFTVVKNTDCLPRVGLRPPIHFTCVPDVENVLGNSFRKQTKHCFAVQDQKPLHICEKLAIFVLHRL